MRHDTRARVAIPAALTIALAGALAGCSDDSAGPETGADVEDIVEEEPLEEEPLEEEPLEEEPLEEEPLEEEPLEEGAGGGLAEEAGALVGQQVTVSATVTEVVSENAIRIGAGTSETLLVVSASGPLSELGLEDAEAAAENEAVVQVTGTVRQFDPVAFEEEYGLAYTDPLYEVYESENVIVADSVTTLAGESVTVAGEVNELISTVAFRLAGVGWDVLVLDAAQAAVDEGEAVQVDGTVRRFEIATIEEELGTDLDDALYEEFEGELVLVAENVSPATLSE